MSDSMLNAYTKSLQNAHQGSHKPAEEAHAAYVAAHVAHFGSASPWATGGPQMSNSNASSAAPTESFFSENCQTAGASGMKMS